MTSAAPTALLLTEGPEHLVCHANPAFLARLGGAGSPLGHPLAEVLPEAADVTWRGLLDLVYRTGEPKQTPDFERVDPDQGARVFTLCIWPMDAVGEAITHLVVEARDVTDSARELQRRQESAEEIRRVNERLIVTGVRMQELADEAEMARRRLALLRFPASRHSQARRQPRRPVRQPLVLPSPMMSASAASCQGRRGRRRR